jgi:4-hydroxy-tetrahydrodipicolinate reductase
MKKLKVAVFGSSGRMGQEVLALARESQAISIVAEINSKTDLKKLKLKEADVLIDFSVAPAFPKALRIAIDHKLPLVSGTTGISASDQKSLAAAAKKIPVLWAPNMSLGVATLTKALEVFSALSHFDFQIEETHHRHKKDKPSGTALHLQKKLQSVVKRDLPEPLALRGGGVFGLHQVHAMGDNETLIFEHRALNRKLFADGALKAAQWLARQKNGLFELADILA